MLLALGNMDVNVEYMHACYSSLDPRNFHGLMSLVGIISLKLLEYCRVVGLCSGKADW